MVCSGRQHSLGRMADRGTWKLLRLMKRHLCTANVCNSWEMVDGVALLEEDEPGSTGTFQARIVDFWWGCAHKENGSHSLPVSTVEILRRP